MSQTAREATTQAAIVEAKIVPLFEFNTPGDISGPAMFKRGLAVLADAPRIEAALARVRRLLDDPTALRHRAEALLDGTAKPLLAIAVIGPIQRSV